MIELLTRLDNNSGTFPTVTAGANTTQTCPTCRNLGREKALQCWRCGGSRRVRDMGQQNQTRAAYREEDMSAAYIAQLCAGIPEHKFHAGMVHVCHSQSSAIKLAYFIAKNILSKRAASWKVDSDTAGDRVAGIAHASIIDLSIYPSKLHQTSYAKLVGVRRQSWKETWAARQYEMFSTMKEWVDDLDSHMVSKHRRSHR